MNYWLKKTECSGCAACANNCPVKALVMKRDTLTGFLYPEINNDICVNCGKCMDSCPVYKKKSNIEIVQNLEYGRRGIYEVRNKNDDIRYNSTSGGVFTTLANMYISDGGVVFGAAYGSKMYVQHIGIDSFENLKRLRQSKYVQSDIKDTYLRVKEFVNKRIPVLFVGSPCQVAGLYEYLGYVPDTLLTVEFICLGVNSPEAYDSWIKELEKRHNSKIKNIWFKYKDDGWRKSPFTTKILFENGEEVVLRKKDNYYMKGYLEGNIFLRDSCCDCQFVGDRRCGDITFGDFWGSTDLSDDMGTSIVILNSSKGENNFDKIKDSFWLKELGRNDVYKGNPHFDEPPKANKKSKAFYSYLKNHDFSLTVLKYTRKSVVEKSYNALKKIIRKILRVFSRI